MTTSTATVTTVTRKYTWGKLQIRADFARAASRIEYHTDGEGWIPTPFQVADFRHSPKTAIGGVNLWLAGDNPGR